MQDQEDANESRAKTWLRIRHDLGIDHPITALRRYGVAKLAPEAREHVDAFLEQLNKAGWWGESFTAETWRDEILIIRHFQGINI